MSAWLLRAIVAGLFVLYAGLAVQTLRTKRSSPPRLHIDPFVALLLYRPLLERVQPMLQRQRISLALLHGGVCDRERLLGWAAESLGLSYIVLLLSGVLAVMAGNSSLFFMGIVIACCLPVLRAKELKRKVDTRRLSIVMELPELLSRLLLMVNAGENVMRALARSIEQKQGDGNPLYVELSAAMERMKRGESLSVALEEMGRRCAVPEVKLFATTLLINARRGGEAFVPALRELTRQMWDKRKAIARTLGEQASSRLAFPLAIVFLLIMVLVGAPTMLMM
ncbi:type II secretion system F family protein [Cohnella silvisoli]|uniref:Type II secretion system F family protein n=1 Tax=Cohnella silvisoli TaxID=2873699 RepID=A0ABV1KX60_9BACL|nr:type II secretion system F family protein [Cohnella silvisoli]MCD9024025.1 type II secretion system F family protein [Cohnella silvisoli]